MLNQKLNTLPNAATKAYGEIIPPIIIGAMSRLKEIEAFFI